MILDTHWKWIPDNYKNHAGFIYEIISHCSHKKYIGKKAFYKKYKNALVESDWKTYTSSSEELNKDIIKYGKENFTFKILALAKDRIELNYLELALQIHANVLLETNKNSFSYYNKNILLKFYQPKEINSELLRKKENLLQAISNLATDNPKINDISEEDKLIGKSWITNGQVNVSIDKSEIIPSGFKKGRTLRKRSISYAKWKKENKND